jgi:hypothetical protein
MKLVAAFVLAAALMGCGKHVDTSLPAGQGTGGSQEQALADAQKLWDERNDEAKLTAALAAYDAIHAADPHDRTALERLTRGWYFYGDAFTDDKDTKVERWGKSIAFGNQCLALNKDYSDRLAQGAKEKDAAAAATKDDVPCLYWTSTALGKWAKAQSLSLTLKNLPTVKAYMTKVEELDPTFFHFGPARYWGAYYSALPSFAGKDLDKSKQYLQASIDGEPNYFATHVIRAEYWAVEAGDRKQFEDDLNWVLSADPHALPSAYPENVKEQEKAKKLLAREHELFFDSPSGGSQQTSPSGGK